MSDGLRVSADTGQGGNNYLASVSDLVSALIFVFIIMLAVFAYQLANVTEDLTAADETRDRMLVEIASRLQESGMRVEVLADQGVLRLSENSINFPSGSEVPASDHRDNVGLLAQAIAEVVPCYVSASRGAFASRGDDYCAIVLSDPCRPFDVRMPGGDVAMAPRDLADRRAHRRRSGRLPAVVFGIISNCRRFAPRPCNG